MSVLWLYKGAPQLPQNTCFLFGLENYTFIEPESLVNLHLASSIGALVTNVVPCAFLHWLQ
jgi:hypothetical protein